MSDFKNLKVWRAAHELTLLIFPVAGRMRGHGSALIRNQWLRATISVPTNIAEGSAKQSDAEFVRFLRIALGSVTECEYHLILAHDLHLIGGVDHTLLNGKTQVVGKMITALIKSLKKDRS
jgi:four helix bundle protein